MDWLEKIGPINLAPLAFRSLMNGKFPIRELSYSKKTLLNNDTVYEAFACLSDDLIPPWRTKLHIYGQCDGTGTDRYRYIALYKALSEGLERWAFYDRCDSLDKAKYGFDVDPSTTGMAAYAGLNSRHVRHLAFNEAVERWSIVNWWKGNLPCTEISSSSANIRVWKIATPFNRTTTLILQTNFVSAFGPKYIYGFACAESEAKANWKALVELTRNSNVLSAYFTNTSAHSGALEVSDAYEKRLLHFAGQNGHEIFIQRIAESLTLKSMPEIPRFLCDCAIPGPWQKYVRVWRVLFQHSHFEKDISDAFLF